jgi:hypothetical protein
LPDLQEAYLQLAKSVSSPAVREVPDSQEPQTATEIVRQSSEFDGLHPFVVSTLFNQRLSGTILSSDKRKKKSIKFIDKPVKLLVRN